MHSDTAAPPKRKLTPRLTEEMRGMVPGSFQDFDLHKIATARCLVAYGRHYGWDMRQRTIHDTHGSIIRVWRVA